MRNKVSNNKNRSTDLWRFDAWLGVFMIWPFVAMVRAFAKFRSPHAKKIVWLFFVFFGFVFVYGRGDFAGLDSGDYARRLVDLHNNWSGFEYFKYTFFSKGQNVDFYQPVVTWIVAYFTGNPRWLFAVFSAVFGYFYVQNMWLIFDRIDQKQRVSLLLVLFMFAFALANPIWSINGVRMWTAAQVFIYGLFKYILEKDKKGVLWIFSSILFHFSFFIPIAILFIYRFLPKNLTGLLIFFYLASFVSELNMEAARSFLSFLPDFLQPRVESYTAETYVESRSASTLNRSLHEIFASTAARWMLYVWVLIIYIKRKYWLDHHKAIKHLFMLGLFMGGVAQILSNIPSGGRFMLLVNVIFYAIFVLFVSEQKMDLQLKYIKNISILVLFFIIIFKFRIGFDYMGISTLFSNPIVAFFVEDTEPLIVFVKSVF